METDLVLVTGAGRGIGRSISQAIGAKGVHVVCISQSQRCTATAESIKSSGGSAEGMVMDISDLDCCERSVRDTVDRLQPRRIGLVLAAAVLGPPGGLIDGPALGEWANAFRTNVLGNLAVLRACLPHMRATKFGRVVALAGGGAAYAYPEFSAYALSKTAMVRAIENADAELRDLGDFALVALAPGAVATDMLAKVQAAGGTVRTTASVNEAIAFVVKFFSGNARVLSGRFVHVRDDWEKYLRPSADTLAPDDWKLRRIE
jgi:NAD(P)-dependent dehydrogenase (short-subunit alcohol dehydrogenase family)